MPILHTINEEYELVVSLWVGEISDSDLLPSYKKLYENGKWRPGFAEIVDLRNAQMIGITGEGVRQLASLIQHHTTGKCEDFKTAVIAPKEIPLGMARIYKVHSDESLESVQVFRDLNRAFKWLGVADSMS